MMYSRTVKMCKARHIRKYISQELGYDAEFRFNYNSDEVDATFTCSDDYADPLVNHTSEDLEEYIIRKYGAFLIHDNKPNPSNFAMNMKKIGEVLTNPKLKRRDNYQQEYFKELDKNEWLQLKQAMPEIDYSGRRLNTSWQPEKYLIRLGLWVGKN